jgi:hypothetical protein
MPKLPKDPFPIEPEYDRHIAPIVAQPEESVEPLPDDSDIVENEDGSATVVLSDGEDERDPEFMENLAEHLEDRELASIANELLDLIERDKLARKRRDEQYAEGIKRTGLGNEAPGGADFDGASTVVHPVLAEGCIDFAARAIKEMFPASGPCKTQIIGEATDAKIDKAERKKSYMNWQLTKQIREYRAELEQLLTQLPLGGSQYLKIWHDDRFDRPRTEFVPIDDIFLPYAATDFYSAHRKTHRQRITRQTFESRIACGLYRDIRVYDPQTPEESDSAKATEKIEGLEDTAYNEDGLREIFEIYVDYELTDPLAEDIAPYIITIDECTKKVLAIYRNWEDDGDHDADDIHPQALDWIVEFKFIPWRGAYAVGLPHIIGSLAGALTGSLRALLDSAHINNIPGMIKLKGARAAGQNVSISPTEIMEIEAAPNTDDIRKLAMPLPFNPPSNVLFELAQWLDSLARSVVGTAEEKIADATNTMPVGTALALIEQGSVTFSAVHARLHASQMKVLEILHRINRDHLDDEETVEELGELIVSRTDFEGPMDVIPVSDPNIFSEAQRYAQLQAVMQLAEKYPQLFKIEQLVRRALRLLNVPDSNELMIETFEPERLDAIQENVKASEGKQPLKAFEDQDHFSHMMTHLHYALSPIFCANPVAAIPALPTLIQHVVKEHLPMFYMQHVQAATGAMSMVTGQGEDDEKTQLHASAIADQVMAQQLAPVMEMLQQAQQAMQQFQQPPQLDPASQAKVQVAQIQAQTTQQVAQIKVQAESQEKAQELQADQQAQAAEIQADQQKDAARTMADAQAAQLAAQAEHDQTAAEQQTELAKNEQDNHFEMFAKRMAEFMESERTKDREAWEMERLKYQEQMATLRTILQLAAKDSNQQLGEQYEQQQIGAAAQADRNGTEDENGRNGQGTSGQSADGSQAE